MTLALLWEEYRGGPSGLAGIGTRVSAINCFEVSSKQTTGHSESRGR